MWFLFVFVRNSMKKKSNEKERYWSNLNECLVGFVEDERLTTLDNLNTKKGYRVVAKYGVPEVNRNGESLTEMCADRGMIVGNTWFQKMVTQMQENGYEKRLLDFS